MKIFVLIIIIGTLLSCRNSTKKSNATESVQVPQNSISIDHIEPSEQIHESVQVLPSFVSIDHIRPTEQIHDLDYLKINGDLVEIPIFEIELFLSYIAEKKLMDDKESIIVAAYFTSELDDIDKIPEEYKDRWIRGTITLLKHRIELTDTRLAIFENLEFPKDLYDLLEDKDIHVLINVFSGRRSTNVNLLNFGIVSGPISKIREKRFILIGGLLKEEKKTNSFSF
jgi:hypothetical protein